MKHVQQLSISILLLFLVFSIFNPQLVQASVMLSISRCGKVLIPALFPFIFVSSCLAKLDLSSMLIFLRPLSSKLSIPDNFMPHIILGWICGFPVGANIISQSAIRDESVDKAIAISSCAGAGFVIGSVGGVFLHDYIYASFLYLTQILTTYVFSTCFYPGQNTGRQSTANNQADRLLVFSPSDIVDAIKSSLSIMLNICAFSTIFSLFADILATVLPIRYGAALYRCIFEFSTGVHMSLELPRRIMYPAIGFATGFGGICVHTQIYAIAKNQMGKYLKFFAVKSLSGIHCAFVSFCCAVWGVKAFILVDIFLFFLYFFLKKRKKVWTINFQKSIIFRKGGEHPREKKKTGYR